MDLRNPLSHFSIAIIAAAVGSLISFIVRHEPSPDATDVIAGLMVAVIIQISFLTYELRVLKTEFSRLAPFVDYPYQLQASLPMIAILHHIPGLQEHLIALTVTDKSKGRIWLDVLKNAESVDATCFIDPSDWWMTSDGTEALEIQRQRRNEMKVRRVFILRDADLDNQDYRTHLQEQIDTGATIRWIKERNPIATRWMRDMKEKFRSPDMSLFTIHGQKLLYLTQLGQGNTIAAGNYRTEGWQEAQTHFNDLFSRSNAIENLPPITFSQ